MITIKVPATTANFGSGFDCVGMALKLYNTIYVEETDGGLEIKVFNKTDQYIPNDENNLIYKSMKQVFDILDYTPKGLKIGLLVDIPMTRGLGSSAACVAGGIVAANILCGNKLTVDEMILLASHIEGHPDNSTPALLGGMVVSVKEEKKINYLKFDVPQNMMAAVFIPDFVLRTSKSRKKLPEQVQFKDAVFNVGRAAFLGASIAAGKFENLAFATEDRLHQPYRSELVPHMYDIIDMCTKAGAKCAFLSGSGPVIVALIDENYSSFEKTANKFVLELENKWDVHLMECDNKGIQIIKK